MSTPETKRITVGGIELEPLVSPGPCSICGKPADGLSFVGGHGKEWQLCGDSECFGKASAASVTTKPRGRRVFACAIREHREADQYWRLEVSSPDDERGTYESFDDARSWRSNDQVLVGAKLIDKLAIVVANHREKKEDREALADAWDAGFNIGCGDDFMNAKSPYREVPT